MTRPARGSDTDECTSGWRTIRSGRSSSTSRRKASRPSGYTGDSPRSWSGTWTGTNCSSGIGPTSSVEVLGRAEAAHQLLHLVTTLPRPSDHHAPTDRERAESEDRNLRDLRDRE